MITAERAAAIAELFGFPADADLLTALEWAEELLHFKVERSSIRDVERAAHKKLKTDPNDPDALCDLQELQTRRLVGVYHAPSRTIVQVPVDHHRRDRRRPDVAFNQAAGMIHAMWVRYIGEAHLYDGSKTADPEPSAF